MNRNVESHFALNPTSIDINRSKFDRSSSVKTTFNVGQIIPFYVDEVLPGDTFKVKTSKVVRLQTLLTPIMDNIYLDTYYFFVPNRLVWNHWKEFMGENRDSAWIPSVEYSVPQLEAPSGGWNVGTIADYLGVPTGIDNISVNALPFRAVALIMDEWFRDENLQQPLLITKDDTTVTGSNGSSFVSDLAKGGKPYLAGKYRDYFTSCLPSPQKGPDVEIPVGVQGKLPVVTLPDDVDPSLFSFTAMGTGTEPDIAWPQNYRIPQMTSSGAVYSDNVVHTQRGSKTPGTGGTLAITPDVVADPATDRGSGNGWWTVPSNLWAIGNGNLVAATINQLRLAFQIQKLYEKDARGGTRYIEILKSHFGVTSPDSRLQRPEYLGGNRIPININQIVQQSETDTTPQGHVTGMSLTTDSHYDFERSFTEHGFVLGFCVARYDHTYQQGLDRMFSRKDRFDYYWPVFANIGEQAVLNKEIYLTGTSTDDEVFGYQEK